MERRILYFGKFKSLHSTENYVTYALQRLGQDVIKVEHDKISDFAGVKNLILSEYPDVVLFSKAPVANTRQILDLCVNHEILTICWQWDLYFDCQQREREQWPQFSSHLVFTSDGGHDEEFETRGINHQVLRQGIHYPEAIIQPSDYKYDVGFVGHREEKFQKGRGELVTFLERRYKKKFAYVNDVRGLRLNRWLSQVKVVVGDSYPSPRYYSNRVYETLGRGGFLLHPETEGLEREFKRGLHLDTYDRYNRATLLSKINYYLENESIRESIRQEGHSYCRDNYTYTERCRTLLSHIGAACR
jgi:hypothetical protein